MFREAMAIIVHEIFIRDSDLCEIEFFSFFFAPRDFWVAHQLLAFPSVSIGYACFHFYIMSESNEVIITVQHIVRHILICVPLPGGKKWPSDFFQLRYARGGEHPECKLIIGYHLGVGRRWVRWKSHQ